MSAGEAAGGAGGRQESSSVSTHNMTAAAVVGGSWVLPLEGVHRGVDQYSPGTWEEDDFLWV